KAGPHGLAFEAPAYQSAAGPSVVSCILAHFLRQYDHRASWFQLNCLIACSTAGPAFLRSAGIMAGVASMLAFRARNQGSAIAGIWEASAISSMRIAFRLPFSATK